MSSSHKFDWPSESCRLCGRGGFRSSADHTKCSECNRVAISADIRASSREGIRDDMKLSGIPLRGVGLGDEKLNKGLR